MTKKTSRSTAFFLVLAAMVTLLSPAALSASPSVNTPFYGYAINKNRITLYSDSDLKKTISNWWLDPYSEEFVALEIRNNAVRIRVMSTSKKSVFDGGWARSEDLFGSKLAPYEQYLEGSVPVYRLSSKNTVSQYGSVWDSKVWILSEPLTIATTEFVPVVYELSSPATINRTTVRYKFGLIKTAALPKSVSSKRELFDLHPVQNTSSGNNGLSISHNFVAQNPTKSSYSFDTKYNLTINSNKINVGKVFLTYDKNGKNGSTSSSNQYVKLNNQLINVHSSQCFAYVRTIQQIIWGKNDSLGWGQGSPFKKLTNENNKIVSGSLTTAELKKYLNAAGASSHLRYYDSKYSCYHSIFILQLSKEGFYFTDANFGEENNIIRIGFCTFQDMSSSRYSLSYISYYCG